MKIESIIELKKKFARIFEGIARGEKAIRDDNIFSHSQAKERMKKWLK